jgi:catechol 2,3-dioxygenase
VLYYAHNSTNEEEAMHTSIDDQGALKRTAIHPDTTLGPVTLAVADAERSLRFYRDLLGFQVLRTEGQQLVLGVAETPLLILIAQAGLRPKPRAATGLYHVAILLPGRADLARVLQRLLDVRYPIGASDHLVSEALYLSDPDGNGLEIYRDRPRTAWRWQGDRIQMDTLPLDLGDVLAELSRDNAPWNGLPPGTRIGHIHLQVADLGTAKAFYHGVLGFDVVSQMPGALFLSAGGYHHHIGLNTWHSAGAAPPPPDTAGLRSFVVELPDAAALEPVRARIATAGLPIHEHEGGLAVQDPWQNTVILRAAAR